MILKKLKEFINIFLGVNQTFSHINAYLIRLN